MSTARTALAQTTTIVAPVVYALSAQQVAIINETRTGRGNFNVVARAGTGKTHIIVNGIVATIYVEQPTKCVAVMAYNTGAGKELNQRLEAAGYTNWKQVKAGTCHSFGFGAWRKVVPGVVVDENKVGNIINRMADEFNGQDYDNVYKQCFGTICKTVSLAKQMAIGFLTPMFDTRAWYDMVEHHGIDDDLADGFTVDALIDASMAVLEASVAADHTAIDFDDMILAPLIHKAKFWLYDYVVVDEAQDTNPARRALAKAMLKPRTGRFIAVGDDRQAIYAFTGADSDSLELITKEMGSNILPLTVTYRCPKVVVAMARELVPDYEAHPAAPEGEYREVAYSNIVGDKEHYWFETENLGGEDVILCRNTKPLIEEADALIRAGIGCMVEGREIGNGLKKLATRWSRVKTISALTEKLEDYRARETTKWMAKGREDRVEAMDDRVGTVQALIERCHAEGKTLVSDLTAFIDNMFGDTDPKAPARVVRLMTLHKSKGREFMRVFFLGRHKYLPSKYARKEHQLLQESNLEYVGLTRTKQVLVDVVL